MEDGRLRRTPTGGRPTAAHAASTRRRQRDVVVQSLRRHRLALRHRHLVVLVFSFGRVTRRRLLRGPLDAVWRGGGAGIQVLHDARVDERRRVVVHDVAVAVTVTVAVTVADGNVVHVLHQVVLLVGVVGRRLLVAHAVVLLRRVQDVSVTPVWTRHERLWRRHQWRHQWHALIGWVMQWMVNQVVRLVRHLEHPLLCTAVHRRIDVANVV